MTENNALSAGQDKAPAPGGDENVERFIVGTGEALHRLGTSADELEEVLCGLCRRLHVEAQVLITPTSLTACFGPQGRGRMYLVRCNQGDVHLGRLARIRAVAEEVKAGAMTYEEALHQIDAATRAPPTYPVPVILLAYALTSTAVAQVLGGGGKEMLAAFLIGLVMGVLAQLAAAKSAFGRLFEFVAPCVSAACAMALILVLGAYGVRLATLAGLIIFLPGMATTTALTELATGHLVAGTSRLMGALVTFMKLGLGVALGTRVAQLLLHPGADTVIPAPMWTQWPALGVAALAIGVVLQAELRDGAWIMVCALVGFVGLRAGSHLLGHEFAPCCAAFSVTCFSNVYARVLGRTASVTQVPAMLLLVPGSVGYRSVAALMQNDVLGGMQAAFTMGLYAMALVAGALLAGLLFSARKDV